MLSCRIVGVISLHTKTVLVARRIKHPKYNRLLKRTKTYLVHDASGAGVLNESVLIKACAPYSWRQLWFSFKP
ncbi:30S ribosomal protein S17 [Candidatus Hodgkinia cicadicola]